MTMEAIPTKIEKREKPAEIPVAERGGVPEECSLPADGAGVSW